MREAALRRPGRQVRESQADGSGHWPERVRELEDLRPGHAGKSRKYPPSEPVEKSSPGHPFILSYYSGRSFVLSLAPHTMVLGQGSEVVGT